MRKLFLFLLLSAPLAAQLTQVSGTITDPTGLPYSNGTITPTLVISGTPLFTFNSLPYTPPNQTVGLDGTGSFVMSLGDVTQLTPSGGTWSFHVCSAAGTVQPGTPITQGPVCFDAPGFIISGAAQNISSSLSLAAPRLTTGGTGGGAISALGTTGQYSLYTSPSTIGSSPNLLNIGGIPTTVTPGGTITIGITGTVNGATTSPAILFQSSTGISEGFIGGALSSPTGPALVPWISGPATVQQGGTGGSANPISIVRVNQAVSTISVQNFNDTVPVAPVNGKNVSWLKSTTANGVSISAALVGDGNVAHSFTGTGTFAQSAQSMQGGTCNGSTTTCTVSLTGLPSLFSATPSCTATPTVSGLTSYFISTLSTTTLTITYAPSQIAQFSIVCVGNGQP